VPANAADYLFLRPGADFSRYSAIMLDPTEVSFRKNWQSNLNRSRPGLLKVTDADVRRAINGGQAELKSTFEKRFRETGFQIVSAPAENALRVFVAVANVEVAAPEMRTASSSASISQETGSGTLIIEVRDSLSGELLGRAVDHGLVGDNLMTLRTAASNRAEFQRLFDEWAATSAKGFRTLVATSGTSPKG
jgi:hypothetical protein